MRSFLIAVLWLAPSLALAQTEAATELFGPANPQLKAPPTAYRSAFGAPAPQPDDTSWRQANDEAGRLRGHAGQLRESDATTAPQPQNTRGAATPAPRAGGHDHGN